MVTFPIYPHMSRVNPPIYSLYVHGYPLTPIHVMWAIRYLYYIGGWGDEPQPGNRFVSFRSFVRACARSGCRVEFRLNLRSAAFPK